MNSKTIDLISQLLAIFSSITLLVPPVLWYLKKKARNSYTFTLTLSFFLYFLSALFQNSIIRTDGESTSMIAGIGMLLQPLLTMLFLHHFVQNKEFKTDLMAGLICLLIAHLILFMVFGIKPAVMLVAFGMGFALVVSFGIMIIRSVIRELLQPKKGLSKFILIIGVILLHASFLFSWLATLRFFQIGEQISQLIFSTTVILFCSIITVGILMDSRQVVMRNTRKKYAGLLLLGKSHTP
jgi:hypothetical protein